MHKISMVIQAHSLIPLKAKDISIMNFDGFSFDIGEDSVPFDWDTFTTTPKDCEDGYVRLTYIAGKGFFYDDYEFSDCYQEMLEGNDIALEDVTAAYLASVTNIYELYYELYAKKYPHEEYCYPIHIDAISFYDLTDWEDIKEFPVKQEVIDAHNENMLKQYREEGIL